MIMLAAVATLGVAALAPGPASAHWGGHFGGGNAMWAFRHMGYRLHFFVRDRFVLRHPFFIRRRFALIGAPILLDGGCWQIHRVPTPWGWR